jgi:hypothetical protein
VLLVTHRRISIAASSAPAGPARVHAP